MSQRRSTIAGLVLAAGGMFVLGTHGPSAGAAPPAGSGGGQVDVGAGGALSIAMDDGAVAFGSTTDVLPGETVSEVDALAMTVMSNRDNYVVNVAASDFVNQADSTKTFAASALTLGTTTMSTTAQTVASGIKNNPAGTQHKLDASLTLPWVDPGDYRSTLTFTVVAAP